MATSLVLGLSALAALVPSALAAWSGRARREDALFWVLLFVAVVGQVVWVYVEFDAGWQTGISAALWLSIAMAVVLFVAVAAVTDSAWRLTPILMPYLFGLGVLALLLQSGAGQPMTATGWPVWLIVHILVSVAAYGLLTLAAVAGFGVLLQERALKAKRPTTLSRALPSVAEGEGLQAKLLAISLAVLGVGIATGMAVNAVSGRHILSFDHKTLLSVIVFAVVAVLWAIQRRAGMRGRSAARWVLAAYLLLTLAYPGVKFVTGVLAG